MLEEITVEALPPDLKLFLEPDGTVVAAKDTPTCNPTPVSSKVDMLALRNFLESDHGKFLRSNAAKESAETGNLYSTDLIDLARVIARMPRHESVEECLGKYKSEGWLALMHKYAKRLKNGNDSISDFATELVTQVKAKGVILSFVDTLNYLRKIRTAVLELKP